MTKSLEELKYLLTEDLYIIDESTGSEANIEALPDSEQNVSEVSKPERITAPVLIVAKLPLSEAHNGLLNKIMAAVKVSDKDLTYVDLRAFDEFGLDHVDSSKVLVFGNPSNSELLPESKFEPKSVKNKTLLWSEDFAVLEADVNQKKLLWGALQNIFHIK